MHQYPISKPPSFYAMGLPCKKLFAKPPNGEAIHPKDRLKGIQKVFQPEIDTLCARS